MNVYVAPRLAIPTQYGDVILSGGPMAGYRVPSEHRCGESAPRPLMTFPIYSGPRVEIALYANMGRTRIEFVRDVPIYEYVGSSQTGA